LGLCAGFAGPTHTVAFDFLDRFEASPEAFRSAWNCNPLGWSLQKGELRCQTKTRTFAHPVQAPLSDSQTIEATLVVSGRTGSAWKVAGVALYLDPGHYWHLALVEAPDSQGSGHFIELHEMLDGVWLAQMQKGTRLELVESFSSGDAWEYGKAYRLRLSVDPKGITGEVEGVAEAAKQNGDSLPSGGKRSIVGNTKAVPNLPLWRQRYAFGGRAVTYGRGALDAGGFVVAFDDVSIAAQTEVKEPVQPFPAYYGKADEELAFAPTGFFRLEQWLDPAQPEQDRVWWFVDPLGRAFLALGTDHCNYNVHWCEKLGYAPYHQNLEKIYASEQEWAATAARRLSEWNFNTLGANNSPSTRYRGLAHTEFAGLGAAFAAEEEIRPQKGWTGFPNVFSPRWEEFCDHRAKEICAPNKDDPWLLGYFLDNEL